MALCANRFPKVQSNLVITDTKGTGISVRIIEVKEIGLIWISVSQGR